jgi:parvulin-like peptidyl-prolyl isomerase
MSRFFRRPVAGLLGLAGALGVAAGLMAQPPAGGKAVATADVERPAPATNSVVATVNGLPITRQELADELIQRKGRAQLELLINKRIIQHAAQQAGVTVTEQEVEEDLRKVMRSALCSTAADFEKTVLRQRGTTLIEYKEDVIRPGLLMNKLAGKRVEVTGEDLQRAFASAFGEKVDVCVIVQDNQGDAFRIHSEVNGKPEVFRRFARQQPDRGLAATGGKIKPIARFSSNDLIEKRAFELRDGEISEVLETAGKQYVILLRERLIPADTAKSLEDPKVREALTEEVREAKLKTEMPKLFKELREKANVQNYLANQFDIKSELEAVKAGAKPEAGRKPEAGGKP